jgi:hypothetical protein
MTNGYEYGSRIQRLGGRVMAVALPLLLVGGVAAAEAQFERALVYLERNVADDDVEVKFVATSRELGFAALRVTAPDGRTVIDFKSPDSRLGIRKLDLESPEPRNDGSVTADFPEGKYHFEGTLVGGAILRAEATLRHALPAAPVLSSPRFDQADLPARGAKVRWEPMAEVDSWEVTLKERKGTREMHATLPAAATSFAVPDGFLVGGAKYKLSVGAILQDGNRSYREIEFTAQKR